MACRNFLCFFLAVTFFTTCFALSVEPQLADIRLEQERHTANVDRFFDALLPHIRNFLLQNGMDPMRMPDFSESLLPLPGKLKGNIDFTQGWLQEMSQLKRGKHVTISYEKKIVTLNMNLRWDVLDFTYTYLFKYLLVKRTGDVYGRFKDLDCHVVVTVDLENYVVTLDSIKFTRVGDFKLQFEGRILDPLLNAAAKAVTTVFRRHVLSTVEKTGMKLFTEVIGDLNQRIPKPDRIKYLIV